jgi:hypothetical protein
VGQQPWYETTQEDEDEEAQQDDEEEGKSGTRPNRTTAIPGTAIPGTHHQPLLLLLLASIITTPILIITTDYHCHPHHEAGNHVQLRFVVQVGGLESCIAALLASLPDIDWCIVSLLINQLPAASKSY